MEKFNLTLRQKIAQMFITGFSDDDYKSNKYFTELLKQGLGGVIFFTYNIKSKDQIRQLTKELNSQAEIPMFLSIDQEGGRVERTENIHKGKKYLSAKYAFEKGIKFLENQTECISKELKSYGINMNFAPVLDVNTNKNNPIIGERAFSSKAQDVIKASETVITTYKNEGIIAVGKHFPGHGDASLDSHKVLPVINLDYETLYLNHIKPFEAAIELKIPAIMAAHVIYPCLDKDNPASLSEKIISDLLIKKLNYKGLIITDDMEMNAVKGLTRLEACIKAVNAGISMFIFRDTTEDIYNLINDIEKAVNEGVIPIENINSAVQKILDLKCRYGIIP